MFPVLIRVQDHMGSYFYLFFLFFIKIDKLKFFIVDMAFILSFFKKYYQSPTSTTILQRQSLIIATHPPILKLEDQLKLHTASTSQ